MIGLVLIPDSHHLFIFIQKTFAEYFCVPDTMLSSADTVIKELLRARLQNSGLGL